MKPNPNSTNVEKIFKRHSENIRIFSECPQGIFLTFVLLGKNDFEDIQIEIMHEYDSYVKACKY